MRKYILTDACYWLALVDPTDQFHDQADEIHSIIKEYILIIPWPILYETFSTRTVRKRNQVILMDYFLKRDNIQFITDDKYRERAYENLIHSNNLHGHTYSLVDSIIREIITDINIKVDFLVTFNQSDFADVCAHRSIEIFG